jgi:hypothetical protein
VKKVHHWDHFFARNDVNGSGKAVSEVGEIPLLENVMMSLPVARITVRTDISDFSVSIRTRLANVVENALHVRSCLA